MWFALGVMWLVVAAVVGYATYLTESPFCLFAFAFPMLVMMAAEDRDGE